MTHPKPNTSEPRKSAISPTRQADGASQPKPRAADLSDGTVIATAEVAYIKNHPSRWSQWRGTNGGHLSDAHLDERLASGAQVLRIGDGS